MYWKRRSVWSTSATLEPESIPAQILPPDFAIYTSSDPRHHNHGSDDDPQFPRLSNELKVEIIKIATRDAMEAQPNVQGTSALKFTYHLTPSGHYTTLPSLPALYHVDRLFRSEARRLYPLRQVFGTPRDSQNPTGSLELFDPDINELEIKIADTRVDPWWPSAPIHVSLASVINAFTIPIQHSLRRLIIEREERNESHCRRDVLDILTNPAVPLLNECVLEFQPDSRCQCKE
ncbi:hypothetical protein EK21DRAFT_87712 [Setomelanomma holmii]|uniref:Uncharacterized protein n=1 Tax=Setomelanomma holmii TaxID=210430 RepID=A0A9P4LLT5_9PLEO|nr:hypothetical protein EK21DRAFT_87712 [Setomelanomma holmii]